MSLKIFAGRICVLIISIITLLLIGGCFATLPEKTGNSKLTVGEVKREIVKGQTTQAEIMLTFGSPNLVSQNKEGNEVWAYNRMSYQTYAGSEGGTLILWGGSKAVSSATTKSFDLIITYDSNDVVQDYKVIYASY